MKRGNVVVEDAATAIAEAGDIVLAIESGDLSENAMIDVRSLVRSAHAPKTTNGPWIFKGVGMGWQDLVVATYAYQQTGP